MNKVQRLLKALSVATQERVTQQEAIDDLKYFLRMPFKAQEREDIYFHAIQPLYHQATGLYANNTGDALNWALRCLIC